MEIPPNTPIHPNPPPLINVKGNHREMGRQIGEATVAQVVHSLENAHILLAAAYEQLELTWDGARIQASKYMPFAQERYPQYVEELKGIAEGANVAFEDLAVLNAMEAVTTDALHLDRCTSMAVNGERTADGHVLAAHSEDWVPEDESDVYIVHAIPDKEPPFLAMNYGGLLPNIGVNIHGIAQLCDSVYPSDSRIGVPRLFVSRAVLAAASPGVAISICSAPAGLPDTTTCSYMRAVNFTVWKFQHAALPSFTEKMATWPTPTTTCLKPCVPLKMNPKTW
jgi:isopenicillin-N N-acyltransferase-like protein